MLADAGRMLGRVLADLANTVNPSLVVLDGPLIEEDGPVLAGVREGDAPLCPARGGGDDRDPDDRTERAGRAARRGVLRRGVTPVSRGDKTLREISVKVGQHERVVRREVIVDLLRARGATTRSDLTRITKLPRAAVAGYTLTELQREGTAEALSAAGSLGRPSPSFRLAARLGVVLGMSMDLDGLRAVLTDRAGIRLADGFSARSPPASTAGW